MPWYSAARKVFRRYGAYFRARASGAGYSHYERHRERVSCAPLGSRCIARPSSYDSLVALDVDTMRRSATALASPRHSVKIAFTSVPEGFRACSASGPARATYEALATAQEAESPVLHRRLSSQKGLQVARTEPDAQPLR